MGWWKVRWCSRSWRWSWMLPRVVTLSAVLPDVLNWSEKCRHFGFGLSVWYILMDVSCSSYYLSLKLRVGLEEKFSVHLLSHRGLLQIVFLKMSCMAAEPSPPYKTSWCLNHGSPVSCFWKLSKCNFQSTFPHFKTLSLGASEHLGVSALLHWGYH